MLFSCKNFAFHAFRFTKHFENKWSDPIQLRMVCHQIILGVDRIQVLERRIQKSLYEIYRFRLLGFLIEVDVSS